MAAPVACVQKLCTSKYSNVEIFLQFTSIGLFRSLMSIDIYNFMNPSVIVLSTDQKVPIPFLTI